MAESVRRRSRGGVLPLGRQASISGSSRGHCASVSIAPPHPRGAKRPSSQPVQARTGPKAPDWLPDQPVYFLTVIDQQQAHSLKDVPWSPRGDLPTIEEVE